MLTIQNTEAIRQIEAAIGYTFRDKRLLVQVFTRKTYTRIDPEAPDNEVLEFYGDTILSYHVTNYFVGKFAHMLDDGLYFMRTVEQFTEMRSHYVRNQYLTDRIKQLLPPIERLLRAQNPRSELPKDNQKAYADLFESLVGAVYLDSCQDDELIRAFILRHLLIEPKDTKPTASRRTQVTVLPAVDLSTEADTPLSVQAEDGESAPVEETAPDETTSSGSTPAVLSNEQNAETTPAAAPETLDTHLSVGTPDPAALEEPDSPLPDGFAEADDRPAALLPETLPIPVLTVSGLPVVTRREALIAFCRERGCEPPVFGEAPKNAPNARPVAACTLRYRNAAGKTVKISLNDSGKTLHEAEEKVAAKMLRKLEQEPLAEVTVAVAEEVPAPAVDEAVSPATIAEATEPIAPGLPTEILPIEANHPLADLPAEDIPSATADEVPAEDIEKVEVEAPEASAETPENMVAEPVDAPPADGTPLPADKPKRTTRAKKSKENTASKPRATRERTTPTADKGSDSALIDELEATSPVPEAQIDMMATDTAMADPADVPPMSAPAAPKRPRRTPKKETSADTNAAAQTDTDMAAPVTPAETPKAIGSPRRRKPKKVDQAVE